MRRYALHVVHNRDASEKSIQLFWLLIIGLIPLIVGTAFLIIATV